MTLWLLHMNPLQSRPLQDSVEDRGQMEHLPYSCYRPAAATSGCSYLIVALVFAEMLLPLAVSGKDLGTY